MTPPRIFLSPPHLGGDEERLVAEAFASNYIAPVGPMLGAFEAEVAARTGIPHAVALSSGTAAIHLALKLALDQASPPPDGHPAVVIASSLTFVGSVGPAVHERCEVRLIDADADSWTLDPNLLDAELTECRDAGRSVAAVIPTDLYGQCCDLARIRSVCDRFSVPVICDAAESMGAEYREPDGAMRHAGWGAWAAVFSFNGNKIITTSGGGMLASHDRRIVERARHLATQAREPAPWYEHHEVGFNYRMSNLLAAVGRGQLRVLDDRVRRKREIFAVYRERLAGRPGIGFMPEAPWGRSTRWLTVIQIDPGSARADPEAVRRALEAENIEARPVWKPMHLQPAFAACRFRSAACGVETGAEAEARWAASDAGAAGPVSERVFRRGLCLPSGTALTDADLDHITATVASVA